jgi:hypothetical protein
MGTIYYALNPDTRQMYELGKGCWHVLLNEDGSLDCSESRVLAALEDWLYVDGFDKPAYAKEIAAGLAKVNPTRLLHDSGDEIYDDDGNELYEQVGSRYRTSGRHRESHSPA